MIRSFFILIFFTLASESSGQQEIPLYHGSIPNSKDPIDEQGIIYNKEADNLIYNVSEPTISVFLPSKDNANGTAVIVCPGGGYHILVIGREGRDIAREFNKLGIAAFVLKYRLPDDRIMQDKTIGPLQDAQKAMQLIRERASEWNIDPHKIGIMGFSAGDDSVVKPENSMIFYDALKKNGVPAEMHIYKSGEHGFLKQPPFDEWFGRCCFWMKSNNWI